MTRVTRGTAAYLSGRIAELAPQSVRVEALLAILGIRGTHFLVRQVFDPEHP